MAKISPSLNLSSSRFALPDCFLTTFRTIVRDKKWHLIDRICPGIAQDPIEWHRKNPRKNSPELFLLFTFCYIVRYSPCFKSSPTVWKVFDDPSGTRTANPLLKSRSFYPLTYRPDRKNLLIQRSLPIWEPTVFFWG